MIISLNVVNEQGRKFLLVGKVSKSQIIYCIIWAMTIPIICQVDDLVMTYLPN